MVQRLPEGARLTAIFDSLHFGSALEYSEVTGTKVVLRARIFRNLTAENEMTSIHVTSNGPDITAPIDNVAQSLSGESAVMALNCVMGEEYSLMEVKDWRPVGIYVEKLPDNRYARARPSDLVSLKPSEASSKTIRMSKSTYDIKTSLAGSHKRRILTGLEWETSSGGGALRRSSMAFPSQAYTVWKPKANFSFSR